MGASSLDEMDPSLADGFHVIYDREVRKDGKKEGRKGNIFVFSALLETTAHLFPCSIMTSRTEH